jgi:aminoglycoside phosphotransferase (APT) family kinase protein
MDDTEVATQFLNYLARKFEHAGLSYSEPPARISGGYDASIFGFALNDAPAPLRGPLILRLNRAGTNPQRVKLEGVVHNWLAGQKYPVPAVYVAELDAQPLGAPFTVMTRLAGKPLAHEIERIIGGRSAIATALALLRVPSMLRDITDAWVEVQLRLHALDPAPLLAAVRAGALDPAAVAFDEQLSSLAAAVKRLSLDGLRPAIDWLQAHRPASLRPTVCHGDFHPLNIIADHGAVTGVIDWTNVVVAPAEMDVGSAIANIANVRFDVPVVLRPVLRVVVARILGNYRRAYAAKRPLDDDAVRYFQVFRCMAQLVPVMGSRIAGATYSGAFGSDAAIANLTRYIRRLSGVVVDPSRR